MHDAPMMTRANYFSIQPSICGWKGFRMRAIISLELTKALSAIISRCKIILNNNIILGLNPKYPCV